MRLIYLVFATALLASCGVDGEPTTPPDVNAGVTINSSGVYPSVAVGFNTGPVRVLLGL